MSNVKPTKRELAQDVVHVLRSPLHRLTKQKVLNFAAWRWTASHGKYRGCKYWTRAAIQHFRLHAKKGLRHEHAVPRKLLVEILFRMVDPQEHDVFELFDRLAIGVVITIDQQQRLDAQYKTTMPPEFDDEQSADYRNPWLRFKQCGIKVETHHDWKE